jgi:anti-sigma regulatory factor (Ser/Thr protein kinase)
MNIDRDLPVSPAAPGIAREALDGWLTNLVGEEAATSARMAATEIVSNAVRHGNLDPTDVIHMSGVATDDVVRVGFVQATSAEDVRLVPIGERDPTDRGIGLRIVDVAATSWGVDPGPPGVVWFEVDRDGP